MDNKNIFKLLAPYFAVVLFWCVFSNAWLAILSYHVQILFWSRRSFSKMHWPGHKRVLLLALPAVLAGPLLYFLLPYFSRVEMSVWLADHHLSRSSLLAMIPYFGLVHPFLEQIHWGQLRERTSVSHPVFAGYHIVVLYSFMTIPGLILSFIVLTTASIIWYRMTKMTNSLAVPLLTHVLADTGVIIVAWLRTSG